nr:hypothetical protein [Chlamydiota bacterium]
MACNPVSSGRYPIIDNRSPYHIIKSVGKCPELIEQNGKIFKKAVKQFELELLENFSNNTILKKASKLSAWRTDPRVDAILKKQLDKTLCLPADETFVINRYQWLDQISSITMFLLDKTEQKMDLSRNVISWIDQFVRTSTIPKLELCELFELYKGAHFLQFDKLLGRCIDKLSKSDLLDDEMVSKIFEYIEERGLLDHEKLICGLISSICKKGCGWNAKEQSLQLEKMSSKTIRFLSYLAIITLSIEFKNKEVMNDFINKG